MILAAGFPRLRKAAFVAGGAGLAGCLAGALLAPRQFFASYLFAFLFWSGFPLGSLALVMLHHLVGGDWGRLLRRLLEAGLRTMPLVALLFLPVLAGLGEIYPWARAGEADAVLEHKRPYLNAPFFAARAAVYFAAWTGLAALLGGWSRRQDETGDPRLLRRFRLVSGPGLVLFGLTATFASVDWAMSLEPRAYSSIYGMLFMAGQGLSALAAAAVGLAALSRRPPLSRVASPARLMDVGNLLFAFVLLWAYLNFSQFLILWSGNLPDEIPWVLSRGRGGWPAAAAFLLVFHFAVPFFLLLVRRAKRSALALGAVAGGLLAMRLVDVFWLVAPAFRPGDAGVHALDLAAVAGVGGIWFGCFLGALGSRPLLPLRDPQTERLLAEETPSHA